MYTIEIESKSVVTAIMTALGGHIARLNEIIVTDKALSDYAKNQKALCEAALDAVTDSLYPRR